MNCEVDGCRKKATHIYRHQLVFKGAPIMHTDLRFCKPHFDIRVANAEARKGKD
jgi:hypothetical protein